MTKLIFDIKTSADDFTTGGKLKTPYPEVGLQLAAYRFATLAAVWRARQVEQFKRRYYLLSETERAMGVPVPEVDGGVALLLTPTRFALHPVKCDEQVYERFLSAIDVARFAFDEAGSIVGSPMIPTHAVPRVADDRDPFDGLPRY